MVVSGDARTPTQRGDNDRHSTVRSVTADRLGGLADRAAAVPAGWWHLAVVVSMLLAAVAVFGPLWADPQGRVLYDNAADYELFEWMLGHTAMAVTNLENPFFATDLGAPNGVNLMANTSVLLPGVILTPVTLLGGPGLSATLLLTLSLAGTGVAWYFFLLRWVVDARSAAYVGGLFCGFAPGMVSQATGHLHMSALFLIPLILWVVLRLGEPGRTLRDGIRLGLLATAQLLTGEEPIFLAALALAAFLACYALWRWRDLRDRLRGALASLALAVAIALLVLGYPLWTQFFGPHAYHGVPNHKYPGDLGAFVNYPTYALGGDPLTAERYSPNVSEQATFFGWPLLVLALVCAAWTWRRIAIRCAVLTGIGFGLLSLGTELHLAGEPVGIPGPWELVDRLPLFRDVIPLRLGMVLIPVIGILVAATWDRALAAGAAPAGDRPLARLWPAAVVAVLVPLVPLPPAAVEGVPTPGFVSQGEWRECADEGGTVVAFVDGIRQMTWQRDAGYRYAVHGGYHITRGPDGKGQWGTASRPTEDLVYDAIIKARVPEITDQVRAQAVEDIRHWNADCFIVPLHPNGALAEPVVTAILGVPPIRTPELWAWDVRGLR
ncbi:hypothetical protein AB0M79_32865 [Polymorphospora sp. NPDC051019]|uniref:hypothetical protein n=1 Tax=Polymorphospora sp. NPDC051019 TaxID=3155725 RepID=UPI003436CD78